MLKCKQLNVHLFLYCKPECHEIICSECEKHCEQISEQISEQICEQDLIVKLCGGCYSHAQKHTFTCTHWHSKIHMHILTFKHSHAHIDIHSFTCTHWHSHIDIQTFTRTHSYIRMHTSADTQQKRTTETETRLWKQPSASKHISLAIYLITNLMILRGYKKFLEDCF